jgi:hypothetical protein
MGEPLERGPSPLQSCMITTAGNGPGPSGFNIVAGICSTVPLAAVEVRVRPEVAAAQFDSNGKQRTAEVKAGRIITFV